MMGLKLGTASFKHNWGELQNVEVENDSHSGTKMYKGGHTLC